MLHLRLADGSDAYVNALAVRYVLPAGTDDRCDVFLSDSTRLSVQGDAKHVAEMVHKGLRIIHSQD